MGDEHQIVHDMLAEATQFICLFFQCLKPEQLGKSPKRRNASFYKHFSGHLLSAELSFHGPTVSDSLPDHQQKSRAGTSGNRVTG